MLDIDLRAGVIGVDALLDGARDAARHRIAAACARGVVHALVRFHRFGVDALGLEHGGQLFKGDDEVYVTADGAAGGFQLFRRAGADEHHPAVGIFLLDGAGGGDHGREGAGNFIRRFGEIALDEHRPGGAAGGEHEGLLTRRHPFGVVLRLDGGAHVCAQRHFKHLGKAELQERRLDLAGGRLVAELPHIGGRDGGDDLISPADGADELEELRFIGDGAEGAADHAHAAGNALIGVDLRPAQLVRLDGLDAARLRAGAGAVGDGVVRAGGLALAALDAFGLVDDRLSVHDGHGALGADGGARVRHAAAAVVRHLIHIRLAGRAGGGNDLDKGRLVVFIGDVAGAKACGDVHGLVFGAERKPHRQAHALGTDGALAPDALAVERLVAGGDLVRDRLDGVLQFRLVRFKGDARHLYKHLTAQFF